MVMSDQAGGLAISIQVNESARLNGKYGFRLFYALYKTLLNRLFLLIYKQKDKRFLTTC
jgi:hypothetical protein